MAGIPIYHGYLLFDRIWPVSLRPAHNVYQLTNFSHARENLQAHKYFRIPVSSVSPVELALTILTANGPARSTAGNGLDLYYEYSSLKLECVPVSFV